MDNTLARSRFDWTVETVRGTIISDDPPSIRGGLFVAGRRQGAYFSAPDATALRAEAARQIDRLKSQCGSAYASIYPAGFELRIYAD